MTRKKRTSEKKTPETKSVDKSTADIKDRILEAALPDVVFDGWTDQLLERAAVRLKLPPTLAQQAFPHGALDLVLHFSDWANRRTLTVVSRKMEATPRIRDKIALGVKTRLEILEPHKQALSTALAFLALPPRNLHLPKLVWKTADALWRAAGDTATDYNHYTKRLLLSGVISSTTLYWLNDDSNGRENTWAFLDRRIDNVLKLGGKLSRFKKRRAEGG